MEDYRTAYELVSSIDQNVDLKKIEKVISIMTEGGTVLDIGCAEGLFAVMLAKRGYEVTGVDISQNFVDRAKRLAEEKEVLGKTKFFALNIEADTVAGFFDWILFLDVIEHLESPIKALRNIRKSMADSSKLIISTPNALGRNRIIFHCFDKGGIPDYTNLKDLSALHLQEYSLKTLARLLNFAGLKITELLHGNRFDANLFVVCQKCEPIRVDDFVKKAKST